MSPKILLVDDEEIIRQLLVRTLGEKGYIVESVEDGNTALEKIKENSFDLLITDLKMPKVDGIEVLREIKKVNPYIEVIIITGYPTIELAVEAIRIGAFDFICKPFDMQALLATVEHSLEKQKFSLNYFKLSELMALFEITKTMVADVSLDTLLVKILDSTLEITKAKRGSILLVDEKDKELRIKVARGLSQEIIDNTRIKINEGIAGRTAKEEAPALVADIREDYHATNSVLSIPLVSRAIDSPRNILGAINISDKISGESFTQREETLLSVLAGEAAVTIENFRLFNELQKKIIDLKRVIEQLNLAQTQLIQSEKLAALGRFATGVAHEVKNPLGIILGGMEFLELKLPHVESEIKTAIHKIEEATLRANVIVQNLLKFARPSESKIERLEIKDLIEDALSLFKFRIPLSKIKIETDFTKDLFYIEVDRNQMQQVLFNILMNAVEAMPGGGDIKIKTYTTLMPEFLPEKGACVVEIIDTGEGIAKEDLPKLFEPFFTTKRDRKGTGLGLFMSRMIVENHKGKLLIESQPHKETSVKVILPIVQGENEDEKNSTH